MDVLVAVLMVAGLVCLIAEIYQPGFIALGVSGVILLLSGGVLRLFSLGEGETFFGMLFAYVATVAVIILVSFIIMIRIARYSWIKYIPDVSDESVDETDKRYAHLCGIEGVTLSTLRPVGKAELCGEEYTVLTDGFFINRGEKIKVVRIEQENIIVRKI